MWLSQVLGSRFNQDQMKLCIVLISFSQTLQPGKLKTCVPQKLPANVEVWIPSQINTALSGTEEHIHKHIYIQTRSWSD